ncbi:MAG: hypothetical protein IPG74_10475 [Flavobacteriales bacterium]|nr:hypothetical protein [Flavobacteriales bacterium]
MFTDAINYINLHGICGPLTFNVTAGQAFVETPPAMTGHWHCGQSIIFQKTAGTNPVIQPTGGGGATDAGITISGGDYITFDGIDVSRLTGTAMEYGFLVRNLNATDGAQNNTIQNTTISLDRANATSRGIMQTSTTTGGGVTPTNASGANSNNIYRNLTIRNVYGGINLNGTSAFPDLACQITTTACGTFNVIGDPGTPADIGGGTLTTATFGIQLSTKVASRSSRFDPERVEHDRSIGWDQHWHLSRYVHCSEQHHSNDPPQQHDFHRVSRGDSRHP